MSYTFVNTGRLASFYGVLTTSAVAGLRSVAVLLTDNNTHGVWHQVSPAAQNPSVNGVYTMTIGGPYANEGTSLGSVIVGMVMPDDIFVAPGWKLSTATANLDAGDRWTALYVTLSPSA